MAAHELDPDDSTMLLLEALESTRQTNNPEPEPVGGTGADQDWTGSTTLPVHKTLYFVTSHRF